MTTKPRISAPDVYYHIMSKGVFEENIFPNDKLKQFFLDQLKTSLNLFSYSCCAWSIQKDHYHLIVKASTVTISRFMQRLNSVYARKYNSEEEGREGVVFYRRFASVICQDTHLKDLIRYVHQNPVRCGECTIDELDSYKWSGHAAILGNCRNDFQNCDELLGAFSQENAFEEYKDFMKVRSPEFGCDVIANVRIANQSCQNSSKLRAWIIGDSNFVQDVMEKDAFRRAQIARHLIANISPGKLHEIVGEHTNLIFDDLFTQGRVNLRSNARELFSLAGVTLLDFKGKALADYLGVTASAVSRMMSRGRGKKEIIKLIEKIKLQI